MGLVHRELVRCQDAAWVNVAETAAIGPLIQPQVFEVCMELETGVGDAVGGIACTLLESQDGFLSHQSRKSLI